MAELRIPPANFSAPVRAPAQAPRVDAARAASRAFFQTAVTSEAAPAQRPAAPAVRPAQSPTIDPQRPLRPGSLVDVKV